MPRYEEMIPVVPAGCRVRTIRAYPQDDAAKAIARASKKKWWAYRLADEPVRSPTRWAWVARQLSRAP